MAAAHGVGAQERDDLLVVEAHAVEDVADVLHRVHELALVGAGQAAVGRGGGAGGLVGAAGAPGDGGAAALLHGHHAARSRAARRA